MYPPDPFQFLFSVTLFKGVVYILSLTHALLIYTGGTVGFREVEWNHQTVVGLRTSEKHKLSNHHISALPEGLCL